MDGKQPLVSIVMPVYNVETYLQEAVESVLRQTFSDWELILVDDGSTDCSGAMCDKWMASDSRIQAIHVSNGGLSYARNVGMKIAHGKWIVFPDSDDRLADYALETMLSYAEDVDVVICMLEEFPKTVVYQAVKTPVKYDSFADIAEDFCRLHGMHVFSSACTKLYRREHIQITFDEGVRHIEDLLFNLEFLPTCRGIRIIPDVLYQYRREQVITLSKRFWMDTLEIRKRELRAILGLFPNEIKIHRMVLHRYIFYIKRWLFELIQLQSITREQKKLLMQIHLTDALSVTELDYAQPEGIDRLLWNFIRSGNPDVIYPIFRLYARILKAKGTVK